MAETFVAVRRGPGGFEQRVCLKRILPHLARDPEMLRLFHQEARLSAQLSHANVVQLLDYADEGDQPYLVFELIEGTDLRQLHRALLDEGRPLTTGLVAHVALEVTSALSYAHGQGVIHRDVSPSNVLLSLAGEVKLTDFGIAKAFFGPSGLTRSGAVKGKIPYIAPEYARTGRADPRADQFSLGVMLYELLVGERPFRGGNDVEILERILSGEYESLLSRAPHVPEELASIVERMLSVRPEGRFDHADQLLEALRELAPPPTARSILQALVRGHRRPDRETLPFEPTGRATDGDTVRLVAPRAPETTTPRPAGPNEVTRTAIGHGKPTTEADAGDAMRTETRTVFDPSVIPPRRARPFVRWVAAASATVGLLSLLAWWLGAD